MHSLTRTLIGAVVALLICGAEAALFAADASAAELPHSISVRYADLNLERQADVATLYRRITGAAEDICGPRLLTGSHLPQPGYQRCSTDAVAHAVARVDSRALSAYHQQQLGLAPQRAATIAQR
jgi:UrcA family protein